MRVTVVGCAGSFPGPDSAASCYLVEADALDRTWRILLDLGNGALGALQRHVDPLSIDAVLLSHLHPDHCLDLTSYYVLRSYHPAGPQPPIPVWGPVGTAARLARAYDLPEEPGMTAAFDFGCLDDVADGALEIGPFAIWPVPVRHPVPAYGFRVNADGVTVGYTGDTAPCPGLEQVAAGVDLLLAEASFRTGAHNPEGMHLTGAEAGQAAEQGAARRLVLTHIPAWHDPAAVLSEAAAEYAGPVELAVAGARYDL